MLSQRDYQAGRHLADHPADDLHLRILPAGDQCAVTWLPHSVTGNIGRTILFLRLLDFDLCDNSLLDLVEDESKYYGGRKQGQYDAPRQRF
jgi:hypothetical protein